MYRAPLRELRFVLDELLGSQALAAYPRFTDYSTDLADSILREAARFAETVLDPLNRAGDEQGARWTPEGVVTAPGFRAAYRQFVEGGWLQLAASPELGGQGAPQVLTTAVYELWASANLAFTLCPTLAFGAMHTLEQCASPEQKQQFLPKMLSGEWTGAMNLTEPQAGSDLAQVRTRAVPDGDRYRIFGQKIFITWGDHDYTGNIVHLVLARIEGAPPGVKGISLFIVPKVLTDADGALGARNDVRCVSIERKLGIHASPTCVLAYGDSEGAIGYLVGKPNRGLEYMFIMVNDSRLMAALQGYAVGERAYQRAVEFARTRVQGKPAGVTVAVAPIIHHADVKRMLLTMKSCTEASRALTLYAAIQLDIAAHHPEQKQRADAQTRADLLIPIVKGWCTETAGKVADIGVQVHGGAGFIEETGAAQYVRDVRIVAIYEGTTAIQSNDLIGRKLGRDGGAAMNALIAEMLQELEALDSVGDSATAATCAAVLESIGLLHTSTQTMLQMLAASSALAQSVSVPYLRLCGLVVGGWLLAKSSAIAAAKVNGADRDFYAAKVRTAHFYTEQVLPDVLALARVVQRGGASVVETDVALV